MNGILNPIKRSKILGKMRKEGVGVALLQETHLSEKEHEKLKRNGFNQIFSSSNRTGHRRGVAVIISGKIVFEKLSVTSDKQGRYILIKGRLEGILVTILNVYAPPGSDWMFYRQMFDLITTEGEGTLIWGGDLNLRLNPQLDCSVSGMQKSKICKKFMGLMAELGVIDVWRELNPTGRDYTYFSSPHSVYSRIDYFLMYNKDRYRVKKCEFGMRDLSDHSPVYITLVMSRETKATLWRLNINTLKGERKEEFIKEIQMYVRENDNGEVSPSVLWDACKAVIRGKLIAKSAYLKRLKLGKLNKLESDLKKLEKEHKNNLEEKINQEIKRIKTEINDILAEEIQKKLMYMKQRYYEAGSKSAKLLAYRLKKQTANNNIYKIRDSLTNSIQYKTEEIHKCFETYYKNLYSQPKINNENQIPLLLNSLNLPRVTEDQNSALIKEITTEEINSAISKLKTNRAPGTDGYTSEFYKLLREPVIPLLRNTFNWVLKGGEIPNSWREAFISVIPKEGKDKLDCSSYRPVSVLNQDYRLFTAILARRLEKSLPEIINQDQTGFIKQRQTQDNIRRTLHVMQNIIKRRLEAVILGLDAEKAFDSVRWDFLYMVMERFGFHETFVKTIQSLYSKPTAKIKINGNLSNSFELERGCRQGSSISPLLFAIYLEPLSQWMKQNDNIKGIVTEGDEQKIALFADDVLIYLTQPTVSLPELMSTVKDFGLLSGYKLNVKKTQVLTFNYVPDQTIRESFRFNWESKSMKYLGVTLPQDLDQLKSINYDPLILKIKSDITRWNLIPFTSLVSRVEAIKMNILPRLLYMFQNLPVEITNKDFIEWDKLISRYIWQGKKPRIRFRTLQLPRVKGGLALPCLKSYYQAAQLKTLWNLCNPSYMAKWKDIECHTSIAIPIQAIINDKKLRKHLNEELNPWLGLSLNIWFEIVAKNNLIEPSRILRWIAHDSDFIPNTADKGLGKWGGGPTIFWELFKKKTIRSFQELKIQYGLNNQDFYRYLQMRHYMEQMIKKVNMDELESGFIKLFISAYESDSGKKIISKLYKEVEKIKGNNTTYIKEKWEKEAGKVLTEEEWEEISEQQWKTTCSLSWREYSWKNTVRYFITPLQRKSQDTRCWRQCGENKANHFHIFWECPSIMPYWQDLKTCMERVLKVRLPFAFDVLYLGGRNQGITNSGDKYIFRIMLVAGKKALTRKWLKTEAPKREDWVEVMHNICMMERLTFSTRLESDKFKLFWENWIDFVSPLRSDLIL